ncbi:hypothetical protein, partial [Bacillus sp. CX-1]
SIFIDCEIKPQMLVKTLGFIHFEFEELVSNDGCMDVRHLAVILEKFFNAKNATDKYRKYLPLLQLEEKDWDYLIRNTWLIDRVKRDQINDETIEVNPYTGHLTIIHVDWFSAREICCGKVAEKYSYIPDTPDFKKEIRNIADFYNY